MLFSTIPVSGFTMSTEGPGSPAVVFPPWVYMDGGGSKGDDDEETGWQEGRLWVGGGGDLSHVAEDIEQATFDLGE